MAPDRQQPDHGDDAEGEQKNAARQHAIELGLLLLRQRLLGVDRLRVEAVPEIQRQLDPLRRCQIAEIEERID